MNELGNTRHELPVVYITHPNDLEPGDRLRLGKRLWVYEGRSADHERYAHEQNEYLFLADHESPGACGKERVHSQSELEALIAGGFMYRIVQAKLRIGGTLVEKPTGGVS